MSHDEHEHKHQHEHFDPANIDFEAGANGPGSIGEPETIPPPESQLSPPDEAGALPQPEEAGAAPSEGTGTASPGGAGTTSPETAASPTHRSGTSVLPYIVILVLLGCLGAGWWYFTMGPGSRKGRTTDLAGTTAGPATAGGAREDEGGAGAPAPEPPAARPPGPDIEALKAEFASLSDRLGAMQRRVDAQPEAGASRDVEPIREKLAALEDLPGTVKELSDRLKELSQRIDGLEKSVAAAREETSELRRDVEPLRASSAPAPAGGGDLAGEDLGQVANLFAQGQYAEAQPILKALQDEFPNDARVWYYSALARGFTTKAWTGETVDLARRGAARERAGTPASSVIDSTLDTLRPETRAWLDYYRKQGGQD